MPAKPDCIYCNSAEHTESRGYYWVLMYAFGRPVWVLHRRFRCISGTCDAARSGQCKINPPTNLYISNSLLLPLELLVRGITLLLSSLLFNRWPSYIGSCFCFFAGGLRASFALCGPRSISKMPTDVADCFEFVSLEGGGGVHEDLIYSYANLATKQITPGVYTGMLNEVLKVRYDRTRCKYMNRLLVWNPVMVLGGVGAEKTPFSAFDDPSGYNGCLMPSRLLKNCINVFMGVHEPYM